MSFLKVQNISKAFGEHVVLRDIHFTLEQGEILSIIGSSGSGKTTLLRCLNFLETPDTGVITVGEDVVFNAESGAKPTRSEKQQRQLKFGLVFQSFNLFPQYTVRKNLTLAAELHEKKRLRAAKADKETRVAAFAAIDQKAEELLFRVGLSDKADEYPSTLSGGQCQRVAIARALMLDPDILCFDEPTSALDPELTGEVLKVIKSLKNGDRTMIIVTHEMNFARNVSDKIIYMADGKIEEEGTPEEVFDRPRSEKTKRFLSKEKEEI